MNYFITVNPGGGVGLTIISAQLQYSKIVTVVEWYVIENEAINNYPERH